MECAEAQIHVAATLRGKGIDPQKLEDVVFTHVHVHVLIIYKKYQ